MRRAKLAAVVVFSVSVLCAAQNYIQPTTTLNAQTANNTSAANNFYAQSNGNLGANNVSKVNVRSLLYSGANTKILAHMMLWFGQSNHMNVGYSSTDPSQVKRQIQDMISRGIDGVVIDWYGPNNSIDQATKLVMAEAENHPGFTFAIMVDTGAIGWDPCQGCSPQQTLIEELQYVEQTYVPSPAYMRIDGVPVVTNFGIDYSYSMDWNAVNAALSTHPKFLFQQASGFSHVLSAGSYSWVDPGSSDYGMGYLTNFYATGMSFPSEETVGSGFKGFNDTLAAWGSNRIMNQQCGQTWLHTFAKINSLYNSGKQVPYLQLVTWNDYEEGTELESGIDDCVAISASVSGNGLQWQLSGDESTIDHYTVYISSDGQNLMSLADEATGLNSLNLCSFGIPPGNYKLFVQAVGKPILANRITGPIPYQSTCNVAATSGPNISFVVNPPSKSIAAGQSQTFRVTATVSSGSFTNALMLACSNVPSNFQCFFAPPTINPNNGTASSTLTLSNISAPSASARRRSGLIYALGLFPFGFAGFVFVGGGRKRQFRRGIGIFCLSVIALLLISCGGSSLGSGGGSSHVYPITVTGDSGTLQLSTVVTVTVP
jgi:hypothetical protein